MKIVPSLHFKKEIDPAIKDKFSSIFILNQIPPVYLSVYDMISESVIGYIKLLNNDDIFRMESVAVFDNDNHQLMASLSGEIGLKDYQGRSFISEYNLTTHKFLSRYLVMTNITVGLFEFLSNLATINDDSSLFLNEDKIRQFNSVKSSSFGYNK